MVNFAKSGPAAAKLPVKIHFQSRPWDLYACTGYTLVVVVSLVMLDVGNFIAILLILFVPGYALVAALFPTERALDWVERSALSISLSIAVVPLIGIFMNFTAGGIRFAPMLAATTTFTFLMVLVAYWRRVSLPPEDRLAVSFEVRLPNWIQYTRFSKLLTIAIVAGLVIAGGTFVYAITMPRPTERFTEFYVLCSDGRADPTCYPTRLNVSEPATVILGVISHESTTTNYTVRVDLISVYVVQNATCSCNQTLEARRTTQAWFNVSLERDQNWSRRYTFSIGSMGLWKVQFLLFANADFRTAYREVHTLVRVT